MCAPEGFIYPHYTHRDLPGALQVAVLQVNALITDC